MISFVFCPELLMRLSKFNILKDCTLNFEISNVGHSVTNVRLAGSYYNNKGRVEIYHPSYGWGTVCDDSWGLRDANVVCRQLGYNGATGAPHGARYGQGRGPILLDDVGCNGSEAYLWKCPSSGWASHNCDHREDASAECY